MSSEDGKIYCGVSGLLEVTGKGNDSVAGVAGVLSYKPTERLVLKLEAAQVEAQNKRAHHAEIIDVLSGQVVVSSDRLLVAKDAFSFQKFSAEFKPLKGKHQDDLTLILSFSHEKEGVADAWGEDEASFASLGTRLKLGPVRFATEAALGRERYGIGADYRGLRGYYSYIEGTDRYGINYDLLSGGNTQINVGWENKDNQNSFSLRGQTGLPGTKDGDGFLGVENNGRISMGVSVPLPFISSDKKGERTPPTEKPLSGDQLAGVANGVPSGPLPEPQKPLSFDLNKITITVINGPQGFIRVTFTDKANIFSKEALSNWGGVIFADKLPRLLQEDDTYKDLGSLNIQECEALKKINIIVDYRQAVLYRLVDNRRIKVSYDDIVQGTYDRSAVYITQGAEYYIAHEPVAEEKARRIPILFEGDNPALVIYGLKTIERGLADLNVSGLVKDKVTGRTVLSEDDLRRAILSGHLFAFPVYEYDQKRGRFEIKRESDGASVYFTKLEIIKAFQANGD